MSHGLEIISRLLCLKGFKGFFLSIDLCIEDRWEVTVVRLHKYSILRNFYKYTQPSLDLLIQIYSCMYSFTHSILLYVAAVLFDRDTAQPRRCTRLDLHVQETETSLFRIDKYQVL